MEAAIRFSCGGAYWFSLWVACPMEMDAPREKYTEENPYLRALATRLQFLKVTTPPTSLLFYFWVLAFHT